MKPFKVDNVKPNMEEKLITFETAKLAKEKGFDIKCKHWYDQTGCLNPFEGIRGAMVYMNSGYAPTQSLLQKWLREKHSLDIVSLQNRYDGRLLGHKHLICYNDFWGWGDKTYPSYELALEDRLIQSLGLI